MDEEEAAIEAADVDLVHVAGAEAEDSAARRVTLDLAVTEGPAAALAAVEVASVEVASVVDVMATEMVVEDMAIVMVAPVVVIAPAIMSAAENDQDLVPLLVEVLGPLQSTMITAAIKSELTLAC